MNLTKLAAFALLLAGLGSVASAAMPIPAPEIDPATGWNALALLGGLTLLIRARRRK